MVYTLFFSRMRDLGPGGREAYSEHAAAVLERAMTEHPGFVSHKTFVAEDGERLTVVAFQDAASRRGWKVDPVHREAQAKGRTDYYEHYRIVLCDEVREHEWTRRDAEEVVR